MDIDRVKFKNRFTGAGVASEVLSWCSRWDFPYFGGNSVIRGWWNPLPDGLWEFFCEYKPTYFSLCIRLKSSNTGYGKNRVMHWSQNFILNDLIASLLGPVEQFNQFYQCYETIWFVAWWQVELWKSLRLTFLCVTILNLKCNPPFEKFYKHKSKLNQEQFDKPNVWVSFCTIEACKPDRTGPWHSCCMQIAPSNVSITHAPLYRLSNSTLQRKTIDIGRENMHKSGLS